MTGSYEIFGLRLLSEIELPELRHAANKARPDVTIRLGDVAATDAMPGLHVSGSALVLVVPDVGRFRIVAGAEITVDPLPDVHARNLRLFLLGSAFGALLHQRALLPLHANAIEIGGKAVAFLGPSGEGKSTLAAWFHDRGHGIIADDVCVVKMTGGRAFASPGLPRLRLWEEALVASGRSVSGYARSYVGKEPLDKYDVPLRSGHARQRAIELGAIYVLATNARFLIERLHGIEAAEAVFEHTYRGAFVTAAGVQEQHWSQSMELIRQVSIFRLSRPRGLDLLDEYGPAMIDHALRSSSP